MSVYQPIRSGIRRISTLWAAWLCLGFTGCAYFWDDVTSKEFKMADLWTKSPDPLIVLRDSTDNYKRARAITDLKEPGQSGGSSVDQERILQILQKTAQSDADAYCRLAAISTLGRFKDPRAIDILDSSFQEKLPFDAEKNVIVRKQILMAMAQSESPKALNRFVLVARQPAGVREAPSEARAILDERLTAVRALAKYKKAPQAPETLVHLLETERDISLKMCAHSALKDLTDKDLPANPKVWREYIATGREPKSDGLALFNKTRDKGPATQGDKVVPQDEPGFFGKLANKLGIGDEGANDPYRPQPIRPVSNVKNPNDAPPPNFPNVPAPKLIQPGQTLPQQIPTTSPGSQSQTVLPVSTGPTYVGPAPSQIPPPASYPTK